MKKIYFLFLCFLPLVPQSCFAQWTFAGNAFTGIVRGLFFNNADTGYAVGAGGVISKTTDGGLSWSPETSGVITDLRSVHFVNDVLGYTCGASGVFLKTTDAGATWIMMNSGLGTGTLRAVDVTSAGTIFVAGSAGVIFKSTDGALTWSSVSLGISSDIIQLDMVDANNGYAVASDGSFLNGFIFKTINGGTSWTQVYTDPSIGLLGLAVADANTAYAGGEAQTILRTTNGGATWDNVQSGLAGERIRSGFAISPTVAYMVDDFSNVFSTTDGGATWSDVLLSNGLYSIYFPTAAGYIGDGLGNVYTNAAVCAIPANPTTTATTSTTATLVWSYPSNAQVFKVRYRESGVAAWKLKTVAGTQHYAKLKNLTPGTEYLWAVKAKCTDQLSSAFSPEQSFTTALRLAGTSYQNSTGISMYPNPAQDQTTIHFTLSQSSPVSIKVYDVSGKEIGTLLNDHFDQGDHLLQLNTDHFVKGIYMVRMIAEDATTTQKLIVE